MRPDEATTTCPRTAAHAEESVPPAVVAEGGVESGFEPGESVQVIAEYEGVTS
ncbi:hypothetical protein [Microbacterium sp. Leaf161]|uniref:hypothetical protein n=1 Tax=Microbacterium sp. Leaf161 TaxID=1736281 RepID=UPI000AA02D60|nr:hypothetical protein [Microbacterium sp. Leaf161]